MQAAVLHEFHPDPADWLIVATLFNGHTLLTADERILGWPGELDRLNAFE
ncbi:MAG: type II toxin-antitoxin system VapC family toxin [Gammaproteobacteria bacterium]|nr:type II toxin-antitoxin system VapC family toxin [Gammaproteobacteria bacterium]MYG96067.1 type II toxin-antitoxin system VapC family toxin [Gammaproteobacteria bacterium]